MKKTINRSFVLFAGLCFFLSSSCNHTADVSAKPAISFQSDVQPVLIGNCTQSGCHSGGDNESFSLVTYDDVMKSVNPGNARDSRLYQSVVGRTEHLMPPSPQPMLSDKQILNIYVWIEQGALNN
ncbi:MAG: hypothetical protein NT126_04195 [Bacteroidetes bacterium]|nr:hypothetical protein [Bacteroidota bacterium]